MMQQTFQLRDSRKTYIKRNPRRVRRCEDYPSLVVTDDQVAHIASVCTGGVQYVLKCMANGVGGVQ
jgi:hypothetical protein